MADTMRPAVRSRVMATVRGRDTRPELSVRRAVWGKGFRYRLHVRRLPGVPDLVLPKYGVVIFVHGCFWHSHENCDRVRLPSFNKDLLASQTETESRERDERNLVLLQQEDWKPFVV